MTFPLALGPHWSLRSAGINLRFDQEGVRQKLPGATADSVANPNAGFGQLITQILNITLTIAVVAVLLYLVWGGIEWITAGGESGKTSKARDKMTQAVIGLVVLIAVVAIMMFVQQLLGICIINFGGCPA